MTALRSRLAVVVLALACARHETAGSSPKLSFAQPEEGAVTSCRNPLLVQVTVEGTASRPTLELRSDGVFLARVPSGTAFELPCAALPDGEHVLTARAELDGAPVETEARRIVVDRAPPALVVARPDPALSELPDQGFVELVFDERVRPSESGVIVFREGVAWWRRDLTTLEDGHVLRVPIEGSLRELLEAGVTAPVYDEAGNAAVVRVEWRQDPLVVATAMERGATPPFVAGIVPIDVDVTGGTPDRVELTFTKGGTGEAPVVVTLAPPDYAYAWDTTAFPEANYRVHAVAYRAGRPFTFTGTDAIVDRTPPSAIVSPDAGPIVATTWPKVRFSDDVRPETILAGVRLTDGEGHDVPFRYWLSQVRPELELYPSSLAVPGALRLDLGSGILDRAGHALVPFSRTWSLPAWYEAAAVTDPAGAALVTQAFRASVHSTTPGAWAVWERRAADGTATVHAGDPVTEPPPLEGTAGGVRGATAAFLWGQAQLVGWIEAGGGFERLTVRRFSHANWTDAWEPLGTALGDHVAAPVVAGTTDRPFVLWIEGGGTFGALSVARFVDGAWAEIEAPTTASVAVAAGEGDSDGRLHVAWLEPRAGGYDVRAALWAGAGWLGGTSLGTVTRPAAPAVSHAADGATLVAWPDADRVRIARWTGAGFAALPDALGRDGVEVTEPALACDPLGRPVLAFVEDGPGGRVLRVLRHEGGGWADLGAPPVDGPGDASAPKLDVSVGVPCVAWTEGRALRVACLNETW